ncbi:MAG: hypothetical protein ACW97A_08725 [Candidatus Thorarchaeota archaeon]
MDTRAQIQDYLDLLNMKHSWNEKEDVLELVFSERKDERPADVTAANDDDQFTYTIRIRIGGRWVQIFCDVYSLDDVPDNKRGEVLLDLLGANRKYAEVCFDYDADKRIIGTSQEMMIRGLNFDGFREEFLAVPWAVKKFWSEIAKKHGLS